MTDTRPATGATAREGLPWLPALAFFLVLTAYYIIRPVRDQLSGAVGSTALPAFYLATFAATLLLTPLFGYMASRFRRAPLLAWSYSFFIMCLVAFVPAFVAQDRIGARNLGIVFFVWTTVFNVFVVSLFWSFMADIYDSVRARAVFPIIAMGGMGGALFGPVVTSSLVSVVGVAPLLVVSAAMLAAALACLLWMSRRQPPRQGDVVVEDVALGGSLLAGIRAAWSQPFLRNMAILMLLSDGIGTLAYTLVADSVHATMHDKVAITQFYSRLDLAINLFGALMQFTVTRWVLVRLGAMWGLIIPSVVNVLLLLCVAALSHAVLAFPLPWFGGTVAVSVSIITIMQVVTRGTAYGMTKPASDALYTRVAREQRYKGKNFVETAVWRLGDVLVASSVVGLRALGVGVAGMALICACGSVLATWISRKAGTSPDLLPEPDIETRRAA
jgi:ATP:ADP antiporter, AAA family